MKNFTALCLAISIMLTLAACGRSYTNNADTPETVGNSMASTEPNDSIAMPDFSDDNITEDASNSPVDNTANEMPADTENLDTATDNTTQVDSGRLVRIWRSDFPIYDGPSYDNSLVGTVEAAGTYTIVEEVLDSEGNLWGRLKSGVGWVDLSLAEREVNNKPPITVARANKTVLDSGNYHYCQTDFSSYAYAITISAHEDLRDVSFFSINTIEAYERGQTHFYVSHMDSSKPLVAVVYFPSLVSLYGIEFTDQYGNTKIYTIAESGRDGSVYISPFYGTLTPAAPDAAPWKTAYLSYIENLTEDKTDWGYSLAYVDSDDIPELFISGSCEAAGSQICSYKDDDIVVTHLRRLGCVQYIPQSGLVYNFNGNMGYYTVEIYLLSDSGFTLIFYGLQEDSYEEIANDEYITHSKYYITEAGINTETTKEAFDAAQGEIFDFSKSEDFGYGDYDYTAIRKEITDW